MNRKNFFLCKALLVMASLLSTTIHLVAQETIEADTVDIEELIEEKPTQVPLERCKIVDLCEDGQYAIVELNGKMGIYDYMKGENVTEIDMDKVTFSRHVVAEDSIHIYYFGAEKGLQIGTIGVIGSNNQTLGLWMDNPDLVATLDDCTTINKVFSDKCREFLMKSMATLSGTYGQIAVLDATNGHLLAWVALKKDATGITDAKLMKKSCSPYVFIPIYAATKLAQAGVALDDSVDTGCGIYDMDGMVIRDHNWRMGGFGKTTYRKALTGKSSIAMYKALCVKNEDRALDSWKEITSGKKETDAMELAAVMNSMYRQDSIYIPTLKGDTVKKAPMPSIPHMKEYVRAILTETKFGSGIQADVAPQNVNVAGLYAYNRHGDDGREVTELSYAGCFPTEHPRYAIGVFIDLPIGIYSSSKTLAGTVNRLIEWLCNQKVNIDE